MSVTKPVVKKALSTDMLPGGLSDRQRFLSFAELFEHFSNTGELDPAEDVPFRAAMNSITIGTTLLGRCDGTFRTVRRGKRLIQMTNDDRYCLARHTGAHAAQLVHRGREFTMRPGSLVLLKLDEPFHSADGTNTKKFTNVHLPVAALRGSVRGIDDLVGRELAPGGALSLAMDYSDLLLQHPGAVDEAGLAIAAHLIDLVTLGLGARGDALDAAQRGGLRSVRLRAVLMILEKRFSEPDFSTHRLAAAAGLSKIRGNNSGAVVSALVERNDVGIERESLRHEHRPDFEHTGVGNGEVDNLEPLRPMAQLVQPLLQQIGIGFVILVEEPECR